MFKKRDIGQYGEEIAVFYLERRGFAIVYRNMRLYNSDFRGEIDILCIKDSVLHVVEVKTATRVSAKDSFTSQDMTVSAFEPEFNLSSAKIRRLHKLRSLLMMKMSEGEVFFGKNVPFVSKVVITGVVITLCMHHDGFNCGHGLIKHTCQNAYKSIKNYVYSIKVRVYSNL